MKYKTLIADPPWKYDQPQCVGAAETYYNCMELTDICNMPVKELSASDSILFLWGTWPKIEQAITVAKAWGFEIVTGFPWVKIVGIPRVNLWSELEVKPQYGTGYWIRGCSEYVLICRRGNVSPPEGDYVGLLSENFGHSRKPQNLYEMAEQLPGPYLELFARRKRVGWHAWGNQIESDIALSITPSRQREEER